MTDEVTTEAEVTFAPRDLGAILSRAPKPDPEPEVEEASTTEGETEEKAEATDEVTKPAETAEGETATPGDKTEDSETGGTQETEEKKPPADSEWTLKAVRDERSKRQALEKQLKEAEDRLAAIEESQPKPEAPDPLTDPEGYAEFQERQVTDLRSDFDKKLFNERLNLSEHFVREQVGAEELDANAEAFFEAAQNDPTLTADVRNHVSPWGRINEIGKELRAKANQETVDPAKIREEVTKEVQAEFDTKLQEAVKAELAKRLPASLAGEQTTDTRTPHSKPEFAGPTPLKDVIGGR